MSRVFKFFFLILVSVFLSSCSKGPSRTALETSLSWNFNTKFQTQAILFDSDIKRSSIGFVADVSRLRIISSENIGSKVYPKEIGRFEVTYKINRDTYHIDIIPISDESFPKIYSATKISDKLDTFHFRGVYEATLGYGAYGKQGWEIIFPSHKSVGGFHLGLPLSALGPAWDGETDTSESKIYHVINPSPELETAMSYVTTDASE